MEDSYYKKAYEELIRLLDKAFLAYNQAGKRNETRMSEALRILGFTAGSRQAKIKKQILLSEYRGLVDELSQTKRVTIADKKKIIDDMAKKHNEIASAQAVHKHLRDALKPHKKAIEDLYHSRGYKLDKAAMWYSNILPPHK